MIVAYGSGFVAYRAAVFMCGGGHDIDSADRLHRDR